MASIKPSEFETVLWTVKDAHNDFVIGSRITCFEFDIVDDVVEFILGNPGVDDSDVTGLIIDLADLQPLEIVED